MQICFCQLLSTDSNVNSFHLGDPTPSIHLLAVKVQKPRELLQLQSCRVIKSQLFRPWGKKWHALPDLWHNLQICNKLSTFSAIEKKWLALPDSFLFHWEKGWQQQHPPKCTFISTKLSDLWHSFHWDPSFGVPMWGDWFYQSNIHWFGQVVSDLYHIIGFVVFGYSIPFGTQ